MRRLTFVRRGEKFEAEATNIREAPLVYKVAVRFAAALGEIQKKPRVAAAGYDTQSFRPLVQEKRCLPGGVLARSARVNSICQRQPAVRLTRSYRKEVDTHETKLFFRVFALLAAIALTVPAFAKPFAKTINISKTASWASPN